MRNKKNINFAQQIQNSLQTIKKTSKDIKQKSKLTQHRNLWVKQFNYLSRLQRDMDLQLVGYFETFDRYFELEIQERQVFSQNNYKNYTQLRQHIDENFGRFQAETFRQVQSLPLLAQKMTRSASKDVKKTEILEILSDIERVLDNIESENNALQMQLTKNQEIENKIEQQNFQQLQQVNYSTLKAISSNIKGFDLQKQKIKKIKQSEQNLINYLECFNDKLSEDEIYQVINEFNHANRLLEETYQLENEKIHLDYEDALRLDSNIIESSDNFSKISHIYSTYIGRGKSVQLYFQRLSIEFPKINRKNLETITSYIEAKIYKEKKLNAIKRNYYRQKEQLFAKVDSEIHSRIEAKIQKAKKRAQQLQRKEERLRLDKELQVLRTDYERRKDEKEKIRRDQELTQKQEQRKKQVLRKLYLDELSKKAEEVHHVKTQKQLEEEKTIQEKKRRQQEEKRKKIAQNKPKVQIRQSIERRKIQKKVEEREFKEKMPEMQAERIKNAIESYNFRPKVEFSEERLNKPTEAMIKRKQTVMDMADKVELSKMTGYSVNQLMSDVRFKLNVALQDAGLSNTDYARELLISMSKK